MRGVVSYLLLYLWLAGPFPNNISRKLLIEESVDAAVLTGMFISDCTLIPDLLRSSLTKRNLKRTKQDNQGDECDVTFPLKLGVDLACVLVVRVNLPSVKSDSIK